MINLLHVEHGTGIGDTNLHGMPVPRNEGRLRSSDLERVELGSFAGVVESHRAIGILPGAGPACESELVVARAEPAAHLQHGPVGEVEPDARTDAIADRNE